MTNRNPDTAALRQLYEYAIRSEGGQAGIVARFLAALIDGVAYPFAITELTFLDAPKHAQCVEVLRMLQATRTRLGQHFEQPHMILADLVKRWALDYNPLAEPAPESGRQYHVRFRDLQSTPGLRSVVMNVSISSDPARGMPIGLHLSAQDSEALAHAIHACHREAWRRERGPIDRKSGESRPDWLCD